MKILSLCDGMSCGQIALERVGIPIEAYYAAEIKDVAIKVTKKNYPNTIHIGDVTKIHYSNGVLYTENGEYEVGHIDFVMFGSPCQSFSRAMRTEMRTGLEDELRSGLFLHCNRILNEVNPTYFLMENVIMKKEDEKVITRMMGVSPIRINSALLTAQNRDRLYWTNLPNVTVPEAKRVTVMDILKDGYYPYDKTRCLMKDDSHGYYNGCNWSPCKRFYRWYYKAFTTMVFSSKEKFEECVREFEKVVGDNTPTAKLFDDYVGDVFNDARYLWKEERAKLQGIPAHYMNSLSEKEAADLCGDGWTIDVIAHILTPLANVLKEESTKSWLDTLLEG